jgi:hypothetical protein
MIQIYYTRRAKKEYKEMRRIENRIIREKIGDSVKNNVESLNPLNKKSRDVRNLSQSDKQLPQSNRQLPQRSKNRRYLYITACNLAI